MTLTQVSPQNITVNEGEPIESALRRFKVLPPPLPPLPLLSALTQPLVPLPCPRLACPVLTCLDAAQNAVSKSGHLMELRARRRFESNKEKEIRKSPPPKP